MPIRRVLTRVAAVVPVIVLLTACSTAPFPIEPSQTMVRAYAPEQDDSTTGVSAAPQANVIAVCYNSMVNTDAEIWAEAQRVCGGGRLTVREDDVLWTRCPLLQPERANFLCVPGAQAAPPPAVGQ